MLSIEALQLQRIVRSFVRGRRTMLCVRYYDRGTCYHLYDGGRTWIPTVPSQIGRQGDALAVSARILTVPDFVRSLPGIRFANDIGANWIADVSQLTKYSLKRKQLTICFVQELGADNQYEFRVAGTVADTVGWGSVSGSYLDVRVTDFFDAQRIFRIYYSGYGKPSIGIQTGRKFGNVHIISHDGVRLAVGYQKAFGDYRVANLYSTSPTSLYSLGEIRKWSPDFSVKGFNKGWRVGYVSIRRTLEKIIAFHGQNNNDVGRIGAEIAYSVATVKLGLSRVLMKDPSQPGPDLYTKDGRVFIEARLLQRTQHEEGAEFTKDVSQQLNQMVRKLRRDLAASSAAVMGFAIFSFIDSPRAIRTIILEVQNAHELVRSNNTCAGN